jgi:glyoxylase-like metal-dependent hydrolase (beta-lactamase superfamily II)
VQGCEVWAPANVAPILEDPKRFDLPCLWPDPVPVDRVLPLGEPVRWHEYELTPHPFPGHTMYAAAIAFEADGRRVVAAGDQYAMSGERAILNYQYRNRFRRTDFVQTAELLRSLRPDVIVSGHWFPREVDEAFLDRILADGTRLAELHDELLPEESFGDEGVGARIEPYRTTVSPGGEVELDVTVLNPFSREEPASVELVVPDGWQAEPALDGVRLAPHGEGTVRFRVRAGTTPVRRARVAAELAVGGIRFGQQAEALVDVV